MWTLKLADDAGSAWASKFGAVAPKTRSSSSTRKGSRQLRATLSWMSGESRDLPHAAGAFDLFLGGLPQQTVASVDHRETPQQFDKMATADLYRDLLKFLHAGSSGGASC